MKNLYWNTIEFNNQRMFFTVTKNGINFISNPGTGISQVYDFYRHQSFEFKYQKSLTVSYQKALADYLNGNYFQDDVNLDVKTAGNTIDREVWRSVEWIPYGEVRTVSELSRTLGISQLRIITALKRNPVLIFIPTHRVIVNSGKLGHFREDLQMKSQLLEMETIISEMGDLR